MRARQNRVSRCRSCLENAYAYHSRACAAYNASVEWSKRIRAWLTAPVPPALTPIEPAPDETLMTPDELSRHSAAMARRMASSAGACLWYYDVLLPATRSPIARQFQDAVKRARERLNAMDAERRLAA